MPILYTVHRPQSGKWFSELRSRRVTLARVSAAATAGEVPGARGTDCSAGTISQCAGPKIQAAREERCSSNVGISTFVEMEEFSSSKRRLVKAPPGFHRAPCTHSALQQQMVHHHRAALWPSKPSQISVPWTCTSFKKKNREKNYIESWALLPWAKIHMIPFNSLSFPGFQLTALHWRLQTVNSCKE